MWHKVLTRIDDISGFAGALIFTVLLVVDLRRPDAHPAWIVFDAAMVAFCLGHAITLLPMVDELWGIAIKAITGEAVGLTLAAAFAFFALGADNGLQLLLAIAIMIGGFWLAGSSARRMQEILRAIKSVKGE